MSVGPGRRQVLALAAAAPVFIRHALAADLPRFGLGVASGQPQPQGMVLWTLLTGADLPGEVSVTWQVAEDENFTRIVARGQETAVAQDQHCVHAEPNSLQPARWYWYRFTALGQQSAVGRTRTAPAADAVVAQLDFAIASCQRWDVGHFAAWRHAAAENLDLIVFLGDYIYEYATGPNPVRRVTGGKVSSLADYRQRYALVKSDPALQAAHAACPWLLVWDDHEVDNDYAGLQGQDLQFGFAQQRADAYRAYWEHMPLPKAVRPVDGSMRIVQRLDWGRLARVHLLDDRQYRDPQACPRPGKGGSAYVRLRDCPELQDPKRSLLGAEQEAWLAQGWSLERPWNLLAQQTLMARLAWTDPARPGGGRYWTDGWDGYAASRQRLLGVVAKRQVSGVVVLGGDLHANVVADLKLNFDDARSPAVATEFCGTSISSLGGHQDGIQAALAFNPHIRHARADQRGYMRFTLQRQQLHAQLQVVADARQADSALSTQARFVVQADQPGAQLA